MNTFTVINGAEQKVGHCENKDQCNILICCGTDCEKFYPTHPELYKKTNKLS
jgi:hypothetical protein